MNLFFRTSLCSIILATLLSAGARAQTNAQLRDSLQEASALLEGCPDSLDLRLRKAGYNLQLEQWQFALNEYDYVLRRDPSNPAALFFRAYTNEKLHRYKFARLDYENFLTVVPGNFEGQLGLALLNQKDKHFTEALDRINRMASQFPDSAIVFAVRAGIEKEQGMVSLASFDYAEALRLDPENIDYRIDYAENLLLDRQKAKARDQLDILLRRGVPMATLKDLYRRCK